MKNILVPIDFSSVAERVADEAARMADLTGAAITLLHVAPSDPDFIGYETGPDSVRAAVAQDLREEHRQLQALEKRLSESGRMVRSLLIQGYAVEKIVTEAERIAADLIVMGSHGHGLLRNLVVGSVTDGVLRKIKCPALIVPLAAP